MVHSSATAAKLKLQRLMGVKSKKSTNGGHTQYGNLTLIGRGDVVRRVLHGEFAAEVARDVGVDPRTVRDWVKRFKNGEGLEDRPRSGLRVDIYSLIQLR